VIGGKGRGAERRRGRRHEQMGRGAVTAPLSICPRLLPLRPSAHPYLTTTPSKVTARGTTSPAVSAVIRMSPKLLFTLMRRSEIAFPPVS
jgi:hypothetical protein